MTATRSWYNMIPVSTMFPARINRTGTLLYDEDCGLCVATATWLANRVAADRLGLLGLQQVDLDGRVARLIRGKPLAERVHFVRSDDAVLDGARAVLAAGRLVPRWRYLAILFDHHLGHLMLEPIYREVAVSRRRIGRLLGLPAVCALPPRARDTGATMDDRGLHA